MKSQRRHELQQNELAAWISQIGEKLRPYANLIAVVAVGGALIALATTWWMRQSRAEEAGAWDRILASLQEEKPAELEKLAEEHPGAEAAAWARATAADIYLRAGCHLLFSNKASAAQELRKAAENYLAVLQQTDQPALRERATFGLGRTYEALAGTRQGQGELDKAIEQYRQLVETWPDGVYAKIATQRLEDLQRREILAFYDEFAKFDPKPAFAEPAGEGAPLDLTKVPGPGDVPDLLAPGGAEGPSEPSIPLGQTPEGAEPGSSGEGEASPTGPTEPGAPQAPVSAPSPGPAEGDQPPEANPPADNGPAEAAPPADEPPPAEAASSALAPAAPEAAGRPEPDTAQPAGDATETPGTGPADSGSAGSEPRAGEAPSGGGGGESSGSE